MHRHAVITFWLGCILVARTAEPVNIQSRSGQFLTRGPSLVRPASAPAPAVEPGQVLLDPSLLAVTCEEVKRALLDTLEIPDRWRHRIWLTIDHDRTPQDRDILVEAVGYLDGWRYRLSVPSSVERQRLVRALVHVMLLEMAQRDAIQPAAELPPWLGDGLSGVIETRYPGSFTLAPYSHAWATPNRGDPLQEVRKQLQQTAPFTMEELNWPGSGQRFGADQERYMACSQLLVHELLRSPGGLETIHFLLATLHQHLNWQTAFLKGPTFSTMLDLDKWWSLIVVQTTGRELMFTWSVEETWLKLEDILATPVQVRLHSSDLPMTTQASLQSILREWDVSRQIPLLRTKANHLQALRLRAAQGLVDLVDGYRLALDRYLEERAPQEDRPGDTPWVMRAFKPQHRAKYQLLVEETVGRLDMLDDRVVATKRLMRAAEANRAVRPTPRAAR